MSTNLERIAAWAHGLRWDALPPGVHTRARLQLASMSAALLSGQRADDDLAPLKSALPRLYGSGSLALPGAEGLSLAGAIAWASALSEGFGFDDHLWLAHPGTGAVWLPWLVGVDAGADWTRVLTAQVAVNEVVGRLGAIATVGLPEARQPAWLRRLAAALGAGLVMGLKATQLAHAMALALSPMEGHGRLVPAAASWWLAAEPAVAGWRAAVLAEAGQTGPLAALEPDGGAWKPTDRNLVRSLLTGLGRAWVTESLGFALTPARPWVAPALEAVRRLFAAAEEEGAPIDPRSILTVEVETSLMATQLERENGPPARVLPGHPELDPRTWPQSIRRVLALYLETGRYSVDELRREVLLQHAPALSSWMNRIRVHHRLEHTSRALESVHETLAQPVLLSRLSLASLTRGGPEAGLARVAGGLPALLEGLSEERGPERLWRGLSGLGRALGRRLGGAAPTGGLDEVEFSRLEMRLPTSVRLVLSGGRMRSETVELAPGAAGQPLEEVAEGVVAKLAAASPRSAPLARALAAVPAGRPATALGLLESAG